MPLSGQQLSLPDSPSGPEKRLFQLLRNSPAYLRILIPDRALHRKLDLAVYHFCAPASTSLPLATTSQRRHELLRLAPFFEATETRIRDHGDDLRHHKLSHPLPRRLRSLILLHQPGEVPWRYTPQLLPRHSKIDPREG